MHSIRHWRTGVNQRSIHILGSCLQWHVLNMCKKMFLRPVLRKALSSFHSLKYSAHISMPIPFALPEILLPAPDSCQITGGKHKAHRLNPALHLVLSSLAPCFYPAAVPSTRLIIKEQLHLYSPKITFGPLKATMRLMWPLVKMSLTPPCQIINSLT